MRNLLAGLRTPAGTDLIVANGRVWCPRGGDVDVERCIGCPAAVAWPQAEDGRRIVRCAAQAPRARGPFVGA